MDKNDIFQMVKTLKQESYKGTYYIQNYRDTKTHGNLDEQKNILDISQFSNISGLDISFRNF
jgi:hypothetical protein